MKVLRLGSKGEDVKRWQLFLIGGNILKGAADGTFGPATEKATRKFQEWAGIEPADGIVGSRTLGTAMAEGFDAGVVEYSEGEIDDQGGPAWPPRPDPKTLKPLSYAVRDKMFGHIAFEAKPTKGNPEGIVITNNWASKNTVPIVVPQMKKLALANLVGEWPKSGKVVVHKMVAEPMLALFQAWDDAALLDLLISYAGCWVPRMVRGGNTLSNHAYATAIDVNVPWNLLGQTPALVGMKGSVRKLVPIAAELRWWWGGWGWPPTYARLDGMHFEYVG